MAGKRQSFLLHELFLLTPLFLFQVIIATVLMQIYVVGVNELFDIEIDKVYMQFIMYVFTLSSEMEPTVCKFTITTFYPWMKIRHRNSLIQCALAAEASVFHKKTQGQIWGWGEQYKVVLPARVLEFGSDWFRLKRLMMKAHVGPYPKKKKKKTQQRLVSFASLPFFWVFLYAFRLTNLIFHSLLENSQWQQL